MADTPFRPQDATPISVTLPRWLWGRVAINLLQTANLMDDLMKNEDFELIRPMHQAIAAECWAALAAIDAATQAHDQENPHD